MFGVDLPSNILVKDIFHCILDLYLHNSRKAWPTSNSVLQILFFTILNTLSHETDTFRRHWKKIDQNHTKTICRKCDGSVMVFY